MEKITPPQLEIIRSEYNFLKYPMFDLSGSKRDRIIFQESKSSKGLLSETSWKVSRGLDYQFPGSLARKIHIYLESILSKLKKPIPSLIKLGSLRQIAEAIGICPDSGKNLNLIKSALKSVAATTIEAKGTFKLKDNKSTSFFNGIFHLYDAIYLYGEILPNGTSADSVYVILSQLFTQNYNNSYTIPLDLTLINMMSGDITSRLYELLTLWFYPILKNNITFLDKAYSEICNVCPLIRQPAKNRAIKQLNRAHVELKGKGIIAEVPSFSCYQDDDWMLKYIPGERAKEWHNTYNNKISNNKGIDAETKTLTKNCKNSNLESLISLGVTEVKAKKLILKNNQELIEGWTKSVHASSAISNKAGFLVKAIEENWMMAASSKKECANQEAIDQYNSERDEAHKKYRMTMDIEKKRIKFFEDYIKADPGIKSSPICDDFIQNEFERNLAMHIANQVKFPSFKDWGLKVK